ncbi:hypothetical protein HZA56_00525 [Candidatus Poribacteria bacterium]|nr:hypothetical protein [Candidatus Poribacteria bacterium]
MRTLLYIPIIHTSADMGSLADPVRRITVERLGWRRWKNNAEAIDQLWQLIRGEIENLDLPYSKVRLYQDGLPVCGREVAIVDDLARAESPNHKLLFYLMGRGATLMGTESPDLLMEEYSLLQRVVASRGLAGAARIEQQQKALRQSLLERRDRFIAARINETLGDGETGVIFLGMLHSPQRWLEPDIKVLYPVSTIASLNKQGARKPEGKKAQ